MRTVIAVITLVACVHAGIWALAGNKTDAPNFERQLASVSYAPFDKSAHEDAATNLKQIRADLKALAPYTRAVRTYSSTNGVELVPAAAAEQGLKVTVGAWIDKVTPPKPGEVNTAARNKLEIDAAIDLARKNKNVNGIVVGNETIFSGFWSRSMAKS
jgi:Exo-beta-1,3-glucanase